MSYDLQLYVQRDADPAEMRALVSQLKGLAIDEEDEQCFSVVRGAGRMYCFNVDGPFNLDPEDIPYEVTAAALAPTHLYTVTVEGSSQTSVPYATRFARKVVTELGGAVFDQQTDGVWARGASRVSERPVREERVATVELRWYTRRENVSDSFATTYLKLCRQYLPEALPRRFGSYEPLQGKLAVDGDAGFVAGWESDDGLFFFDGSLPSLGGALPGRADAYPRGIWWMALSFLAEPLVDRRWRDGVQQLFVRLADELHAAYASAEVLKGAIWTGRSLAYDDLSEIGASPNTRDGWAGLPPYPVWWAYYGEEYAEVVADEFVVSSQPTRHGTFHSRSTFPSGHDDLLAPLTNELFPGRTSDWVDPALVSTLAPNKLNYRPHPLNKAPWIPPRLLTT